MGFNVWAQGEVRFSPIKLLQKNLNSKVFG